MIFSGLSATRPTRARLLRTAALACLCGAALSTASVSTTASISPIAAARAVAWSAPAAPADLPCYGSDANNHPECAGLKPYGGAPGPAVAPGAPKPVQCQECTPPFLRPPASPVKP